MPKCQPQFSVAIPTFNRADLLEETLEAVLGQSYPASEIVVVDDGSTDSTWSLLESYGNKVNAIKISNSGCGQARKIAAENCHEPWIAFCDSDDIWLPNHLERRAELLQSYPQADFTYSDMQPFGPNSLSNNTYYSAAPKEWWDEVGAADENGFLAFSIPAYRHLLRFNPIPVSTTVMSNQLYKQLNGINTKYSRMQAEDSDLTRRASIIAHIVCDTEVTAKQRRHEDNMSTLATGNLIGKIKILEDHMHDNICPEQDIQFVEQIIEETLEEIVMSAFWQRDYSLVAPIAEKIKLRKLPMKVSARLAVLFLYSKFNS